MIGITHFVHLLFETPHPKMEQQIPQKVNWTSVITYYLLACLISWPFFWWRDMESASWQQWHVPGMIKTASYMWGPAISSIICHFLFRKTHPKTITFFGTSTVKSLLFWFVPAITLSIFSLKGEAAIALPTAGFLMMLGEELGWRGFLQDALRPLTPVKRYMLIGAMWEIWHFTNRTSAGLHPSTFIRVGVMMVFCIGLSFLMGWLTDKTKSLTVAITVHGWVDILSEFSSPATWIVLGCSLPFWIYIISKWKPAAVKEDAVLEQEAIL